MTGLDKMKALALIENKEMIAKCGGRSLNYGIVQEHQKSSGKPRMSDIGRSKPAQDLLRLAEQGFSLAEAARITRTPVEEVISKSNRYQITFEGSSEGYGYENN